MGTLFPKAGGHWKGKGISRYSHQDKSILAPKAKGSQRFSKAAFLSTQGTAGGDTSALTWGPGPWEADFTQKSWVLRKRPLYLPVTSLGVLQDSKNIENWGA